MWLLIGLVMVGAVFWVSLTPVPVQPVTFDYSDKLAHTAAYGLLMWWFAVTATNKPALFIYAAAIATMGISIEFLQEMTGYRYFESADMVANTLGVVAGWFVSIYLVPRPFQKVI
jgi:VanZ family protein